MHGECEEVLFEVCVFCYVDIELTKHSLDNCRRDSRIIVICFDTEMEKKGHNDLQKMPHMANSFDIPLMVKIWKLYIYSKYDMRNTQTFYVLF